MKGCGACLQQITLKIFIKLINANLVRKSNVLISVEKDVVDLQQYIRRNNIEVVGIPSNIVDKDLERTVIDIADSIDVKISKNDIEACHRLKDRRNPTGPKRTIVRFINRKKCDALHRNKKKLKDDPVKDKIRLILGSRNKVFINANLCP